MEKVKVYVPVNDVVYNVDGFKHLREALEIEPEAFDYTGSYIVVEHDWLSGYVNKHFGSDLDEWEDEYTVDETEGLIVDAIKDGKLIAYGMEDAGEEIAY